MTNLRTIHHDCLADECYRAKHAGPPFCEGVCRLANPDVTPDQIAAVQAEDAGHVAMTRERLGLAREHASPRNAVPDDVTVIRSLLREVIADRDRLEREALRSNLLEAGAVAMATEAASVSVGAVRATAASRARAMWPELAERVGL
jgi:hypothetical protein